LGDAPKIARVYRVLESRKLRERRYYLLANRNREGAPLFDDLAKGLETGAISRGKAIKLGGAALVASALGLFASQGADAQEVEIAITRRRCARKFDRSDFCRQRGATRCSVCCNRESRRPKACCGVNGCRCCRRRERCLEGRCV
jgi:hypothetical protein